ncbi:hypothetical protein H0H92_007070 [Tricholoma furcatifolium]|nr:hypothetical protein H0H92_007070 [Tricholoma furcatifolium]
MTTTAPREKLAGYEFYRKVLGSPKCIVAPMVDQSELAFRTLTRRHGAQLVYTPMINAKMFADTTHKHYREQYFDIASLEEGSPADRPLIVQFCANSPEHLLKSAQLVQDHCDGVDINLGCPQEIARRGHYGSFLQDEWDLIFEMINTLHKNLSVPVTAKFRIFPSIEKTVEYAKMLESAGAQIITCHGRTREQRGVNTGLASYEHIRAVKAAVSIPVFANGNILFPEDIDRCLAETGADGVMSAEGTLYNPALFADSSSSTEPSTSRPTSQPIADLALSYLSIVRTQRTRTSPSAVKGHLFKILRPALGRPRYHDLREQIGKVRVDVPRVRPVGNAGDEGGEGHGVWDWVDAYVKIVHEAKVRLEEDAQAATDNGRIPLEELVTKDTATGLDIWPHWVSQPYFRALPPPKVGKVAGEQGKGKNAKKGNGGKETKAPVLSSVIEDASTIPAKRSAATSDERPETEIAAASYGDEERVKRVKIDPPPAAEAITVPA